MFYKLFRSNKPIMVFMIPLVAILIWLPNFISPEKVLYNQSQLMPFSKWLLNILHDKIVIINILVVAINIINAFIISKINNHYILISDRTYLPSFIYLFLTSFILTSPDALFLLLNILFILIITFRIFQITVERNLIGPFFESGFLLGISTLFYFDFWIFIAIIWIILALLRSFYWREYFMVIVGFFTPFFFVASIFFLKDNINSVFDYYNQIMQVHTKTLMTLKNSIFYGVIVFLFLLAILSLNLNLMKKKINARKHFKIFLWSCFIPVIAYFTLNNIKIDIFILASIPIAFLFADFFVSMRSKWLKEVLFIILLGGISVLYLPI